jgi:hypothetical protein
MNIYHIRQFWFDDFYDNSGSIQRSYITVTDFEKRNIQITAQLNVLGPGAHIEIDDNKVTGSLGNAAVGIKWYEYIDDDGNKQHVDTSYFVPHATIRKCVGVQLKLAYRRIWVGATGFFVYFTD